MWDHSIILKFYRHKNILQIFVQISKFDNLIQHYPKFYGIPTLVHPRVGDNIFYLKLFFLTKPLKEKKNFQVPFTAS